MAVSLSIDLTGATFADLRALVDAARTAGVADTVTLNLEDTTLIVTAEDTAARPQEPKEEVVDGGRGPQPSRSPFDLGGSGAIGDAAIRSVIDILTGRQAPPRGND